MSKLQLKKELAGMSPEQIIQVVLDAYSARKEIRDYFEFFLDPDVERLAERTLAVIDRELARGRYGRSNARITIVRRAIRDFMAFDPGAVYVRDLMLATLRRIVLRDRQVHFKDTMYKGFDKLVDDTIAYADAHALVDSTLAALTALARDPDLATPSFRRRHLARFL